MGILIIGTSAILGQYGRINNDNDNNENDDDNNENKMRD